MRDQLASIENTTPGKAIQDFDKKCKILDTTIDSTSQHLKELGFDYVTLDLEGITSGSYDR